MATYQTYQEIGIKEEIADVISNISPTKTPFLSSIGREKVANTLYQWQEDSLRAVAVNAQVEGADATDITVTPTVMRNNYTQILSETVKTADTLEAISLYGRAREMAYQLAKSAAQVKRDLENALVGTKQTAVVGNASTARKFAGYQAQIAVANITYTGAGPAPLDETSVLANLQACYTAGAEPDTLSILPADAIKVANFAKQANRTRQIVDNQSGSSKLVNTIDVYVSPFGPVNVILNRFQGALDSLVYDAANWKLATLRNWSRTELAKTGDATKMMIVGEFGLMHNNQLASGLIVQGTTGL